MIRVESGGMIDVRCVKCNRLLMKVESVKGEIKCPKCGYICKVEKIREFVVMTDDSLKEDEWNFIINR